jgi:hypothetical protein
MQINSSNSFTPQSTVLVDNRAQVSEQREQLRISQETEKQNKEQPNSQKDRFDVDQQALAFVEQSQNNQTLTSQPRPVSTSSAQAGYDKPPGQNQTAVAAYTSVDNISQRESIQQVFGIDLLV